jgi:hypothetical protein
MVARRLPVAVLLALFAGPAAAQEAPQWPPPEGISARMRELQLVIIGRDSTLEQRERAREELVGLLKSSAGRGRGRGAEERPPRAAIDPFPSVVRPLPPLPSQAGPKPEVGRIEVVVPPRAVLNPRTGSAVEPSASGRFAIDPRTGAVLHESGPGFVDPRTGQYVPR